MGFGDVVDQFLNEHGLANAGAAEQANLAALGVRRQKVNNLDAGDKDLRFRRLFNVSRRFLMDRAADGGLHRAGFVNRLTDDVHDAAERLVTNRNGDRRTGINH